MIQPTEDAIKTLIELYQSGNLDEAEAKANELLKDSPNEVTILNILGVIQDGKGQSDKAIQTYTKALQINDKSPETHFNMGSVFHKIAKNKDARTCYEKAINLKPDFVNAYFNLALVC